MVSWYDTVAGALDHAAGSTDEATSGVVDGVASGDYFRAGQDDAGAIDHAMGRVDEWMAGGTSDDVIDAVFVGHAGDTIDVFGPTVSDAVTGTFDTFTTTDQERANGGATKESLLRWGVLGVVVLGVVSFVFAPLFELAAAALGGDDGGA